MLYRPKKTNLLKAKSAKMLYCPKKTKKTKVWRAWAPPGPGGLQTLVFLVFLGQYSIFARFGLKTLVFVGTVRRFCSPRPPKCCTVPKKPIFLKQKVQKCCTVPKKPKKPKFGELGLLQGLEVCKLWLRRFCSPRPPKCCTVPKKPIFLKQKVQKCCTVPKKPKKHKFGELGLLQGLEVSKLWFFWFFWDSTTFLLVLA